MEIAQQSLDIHEPSLPRQWKMPRHYEDKDAEAYYHVEPKAHYRQMYYQAIDSAIATITDYLRNSDRYNIYAKFEQV